MRNIHEWGQKIKLSLEEGTHEWGLLVVVFLLALGSFGLGRLSALEQVRPPITLFQAPAASHPRPMVLGGLLVASRAGNQYFYPWCAGAAKIVPENQIWFANEREAQNAGLKPAKGCKGLEK